MSQERFRALVLEQQEGKVQASFQDLTREALPAGDVLVAVEYSSLNYKDGLAVTGMGRVVRSYPMVPGIDLAGRVVESASPRFRPGDRVVLTGWGVGEAHWGGYAQLARVKSDWLIPLPEALTPAQAMAIGTAGLTAMLCVLALEEQGLAPGNELPVLVSGAAGGVGSVAVAILAKLGHKVAAATGRAEAHEYLRSLGAQQIVDRATLAAPSPRPLESPLWGGAIDTVGGDTLAAILRTLAYGASVAATGLAGGSGLTTTVLPFILRGVRLVGVDSVLCPAERRQQAWLRLTRDLPLATLEGMTHLVPLSAVPGLAPEILKGQVRGRIVVDVNA